MGLCSAMASCPMQGCTRAGCRNPRAGQLTMLMSPLLCSPATGSSPLMGTSCWGRNIGGRHCQGDISLLPLGVVQHLSHCSKTDPPAFAESPGVDFLPQPAVQHPASSCWEIPEVFLELKVSAGLDQDRGMKDGAEKPEKPFNRPSGPVEDGAPAQLPLMDGFSGQPEA